MADLIVVTFKDETAVFSLRAALGKLQRDFIAVQSVQAIMSRL